MSDCRPECQGITTPGGPWGPPEGVSACVSGCPCDGCEVGASRCPHGRGPTVRCRQCEREGSPAVGVHRREGTSYVGPARPDARLGVVGEAVVEIAPGGPPRRVSASAGPWPMLRLDAPGHDHDPEVRAWLDEVARRIEATVGPGAVAAVMGDEWTGPR